ncbi:hypothetical protein BC829DRAFT_399191 [Chytridium lagenaria]|nr:hypothetical protein BC829DRAFT_399191 [Chytridium lagenaria]
MVEKVRAVFVRFTALLLALCTWTCRPFLVIVFILRVIAEFIISMFNVKFPSSNVALKDISAGAHQVDIRLQQACFWPWEYFCWSQYIGYVMVFYCFWRLSDGE